MTQQSGSVWQPCCRGVTSLLIFRPQRRANPDVPPTDGRRIEVVANGLPLWQGAQIAVDTTLVSPLQRDGQPRPGAVARPVLALAQAAACKRRTYPELQPGGRGRCRLVVFGLEVGGRFSGGALALLAAPTAREGCARENVGPGSRKSSASPKVDGPRGARSNAGARTIAPGVAGPAGRRQRQGGHSLGRATRRVAVSRLEPELSIGQVQKNATKNVARDHLGHGGMVTHTHVVAT